MKKILILAIVLAALIGVAVFKKKSRTSSLSTGSRKGVEMRELLFPDLDVNSVRKIRIKDDKSEVNVSLVGTAWTVAERGGYDASFDRISRALMALKEQKIGRGQPVGKDSWSKIGVQPPGEPNASGIGTLVELLDEKGNIKSSFVLGGNVSSSGSLNASPFGGGNERLVRMVAPDDGQTIWTISNTFSDIDSKPDVWLEKAFFDIVKPKSITVTAPTAADSWSASRKDAEATDFMLENAKEGERFDNGKVALGTLLSSPTFNDVLAKDKVAETMKDAFKARITTFEGFTYDVQVAKKTVEGADKFYLTVLVKADIPKERTPVKDEKEVDKKKNDEAFAAEKKTKEEKLANEKKLEGWGFEVSEYTVSALLKKRSEILADPEPKIETPATPSSPTPMPPAAPSSPAPMPPAAPSPPASVPPAAPTSDPAAPVPPPAVELKPVPASDSSLTKPSTTPLSETPKVELKPAPNPEANPAVEVKK